ncbi:MAG: leucine-rich repeat protein, partial [Acutalibacteraceae bacterium]|nr:leucine-rich repeat protein [Acutalibacteraceae bacterium]
MKKFLSLILAVCLVVAMVPMTASAETATSGTTGDCTWSLVGTVLTISGNGEMGDYYGPGRPWGTDITEAIIENGVTRIGGCAFRGCSNLTSVTIPNSVLNIYTSAFEYCSSLTTITIPNSVTYIDQYAFDGCASLTDINVDKENEYFSSIDGVLFNKYLEIIIKYPEGKTASTYSIPDGVTSIDGNAFYKCSNLIGVTIPNSITYIGRNAFSGCTGLTSMTLPNSVTRIDEYAFEDCNSLTNISVDAENENYTSKEGVLFDKNLKTIIKYPAQKTGSTYSIPDSVKIICNEVFYNCENLTNITIPNGVINIGSDAFKNTGYYNNAENWQEDVLYIGNYLIDCKQTKTGEYKIKDGTKLIADEAISNCYGLTSVIIPDSVTSIGESAFDGCASLTDITTPDSVTYIGQSAFPNTEYYNNAENWQEDVLYVGNHLITCKQTKTGEYKIKDGTKTIADMAFYNCTGLTNITIPDGVKSIGELAFSGCSSLKSITIPNSVTSMGDMVLYNCENLTSATIQGGVTRIGDSAFQYCENLASITLPNSLTSIGDWAFNGCFSLTSITIPEGVKSIGEHAFAWCRNLKRITIPNSVTSIGNNAFEVCDNLTSINIPNGLTVLNESVLRSCYNLSKIYIPKSLTLIKDNNFVKFWGKDDALKVYYGGTEDYWAKITALDGNKRLEDAIVKYNQTGLPAENTNYGDWKIDAETSGIYDIAPSTEIDGFETENVLVFDKNEKEVKYNADKLGWPLTKGESYTIKLKQVEDTTAYDDVVWAKTLKADTIFPDTSADGWYNDAVNYAVGAGIMTGYASNGFFGTSDSIQRQDFIVMLARYDGVDLSTYASTENKFPDVDNNGYYAAAVKWGADKGIIKGYTAGENAGLFGVGDTITREQLVTMLYRYAKYKGKDVNVASDAEETAMSKFGDYSKVSVFSKDAVLWATEKGVITGKGVSKDAIDPQGNAQRCEVAQIMYNIFKNNIL